MNIILNCERRLKAFPLRLGTTKKHGTTDWFQIGKGVCQGYILSPCLFNFYAGEGNGTPLQYSCLENSMDRGSW